jgi:Domain of unknown function (DUF4070)
MAFILNAGAGVGSPVLARRDDLTVVVRIVWSCILRASPRRAWLTLSMCLETAWRRPRAIRRAFTLALMHKHFYEYVRDTSRQLESLVHEQRESQRDSGADARWCHRPPVHPPPSDDRTRDVVAPTLTSRSVEPAERALVRIIENVSTKARRPAARADFEGQTQTRQTESRSRLRQSSGGLGSGGG